MVYIQTNKNQNWLLPLSIMDMIPDDHICFLVEEFVKNLDYTNFDIQYGGAGHPAYHPGIIMKIIIQGMLSRIQSSRKLSAYCRENFVMMYLAEKANPDFRTIARFRKNNALFIKDTFRKKVEMSEIAMCNPRAFARGKKAISKHLPKSKISDDHQKCFAFLRCSKTLFRTLVRDVFDNQKKNAP